MAKKARQISIFLEEIKVRIARKGQRGNDGEEMKDFLIRS